MAGSIIMAYIKPYIFGKFYFDAVWQLRIIPKKVKVDDGTKYAIIQPIHNLLRGSVGDNDCSINA